MSADEEVIDHMARTRSIKPGFFDNDVLGDLPPLTRLLFIGLWCIADREGRLEDRPRKIKKAILGYDDVDSDGVDQMLQSLQDNGFIIRYEVEGNRYIQVINFVKHQNPHMKEKPSEIPPPKGFAPGTYKGPMHEESTGYVPDEHDKSTDGAAPITFNLLPTTGNPLPDTSTEEPEKNIMEKRFALFWETYPKKKAKKTAWNAFKKAKPDEQLFKRIMVAIECAKKSQEWIKDNGQYIPNPATWLNGGCWDDEYKEVTELEANRKNNPRSTIAGFKPAEPEDTPDG